MILSIVLYERYYNKFNQLGVKEVVFCFLVVKFFLNVVCFNRGKTECNHRRGRLSASVGSLPVTGGCLSILSVEENF
jgi:hypothetical protein